MNQPKRMKTDSSTNQENPRDETTSAGNSMSDRDRSTLSSASSSANPDIGFERTNHHMRSVLMHPMGLPLVVYLNGVQFNPNEPAYIRNAINSSNPENENQNWRGNVFAATAWGWQRGEKELTKQLSENIQSCIESNTQSGVALKCRGETKITGVDGPAGKVDLTFHDPRMEEGRASMAALFEFGIGNQHWWKKQDQILKYVTMLRVNKDQIYKIDRPMLLSVITINALESCAASSNDNNNSNQTKEIFQSNLDKISKGDASYDGNAPFEARFGVFLCTPKDTDDFRIALLWRHATTTLQDASTQFGKILNAVQLCANLGEYCKSNESTIQYKYLGPNCCKLGDSLLRSYDIRLRPTDRRPDLYLQPNLFNDGTNSTALTVIEITDRTSQLDFGQLPPNMSSVQKMDWLWESQGKLLVISTVYRIGVHYATRPRHFLPIVEHLEHLHRQGFVHGDIRAYNMVLNYDEDNDDGNNCKGWLIDFDFGGTANTVQYPKGYKRGLDDGVRPGTKYEKITMMDDWKSLIGLITFRYCQQMRKGAGMKDSYISCITNRREELQKYCLNKPDPSHPSVWEFMLPCTLLKQYLNDSDCGYDVVPSPEFAENMLMCGLSSAVYPLKASQAATGSPPVKKSQ